MLANIRQKITPKNPLEIKSHWTKDKIFFSIISPSPRECSIEHFIYRALTLRICRLFSICWHFLQIDKCLQEVSRIPCPYCTIAILPESIDLSVVPTFLPCKRPARTVQKLLVVYRLVCVNSLIEKNLTHIRKKNCDWIRNLHLIGFWCSSSRIDDQFAHTVLSFECRAIFWNVKTLRKTTQFIKISTVHCWRQFAPRINHWMKNKNQFVDRISIG